MATVDIIGIGTTPIVERNLSRTFKGLAFDVAKKAMEDAGISKEDIGHVVYSIHSEAMLLQQIPTLLLQDYLGFQGLASTRLEAGAATEGYALAAASDRIRSGRDDIVLLIAVQKTSDFFDFESGSRETGYRRGNTIATDAIWLQQILPCPEAFMSTFCLEPRRAKHGGPTREQMAAIAVKNRRNAARNPEAQLAAIPTMEEVLGSDSVAGETTRMMCATHGDGACALVLASGERAAEMGRKGVRVTGLGVSTHSSYTVDESNIGRIRGTQIAAARAYEQAGIGNPAGAFDLAQVHDLTAGIEAVACEELGFCEPGEGGKLARDGVFDRDGRLPVNTDGGRIGCGHAGGISGIYGVCEIVRQLRETAGARQVPIRNGTALMQCTDAHLSMNSVATFSIRETA